MLSSAHHPTLLYVSPVIPAFTGNGVAMRAAATISVLARHYRVSLLVIPLMYSSEGRRVPETVTRLCQESTVVSAKEAGAGPVPFQNAPFHTIHVFRLYMEPYARPYLLASPSSQRHIDLDDMETISRRRIAVRYRHHGLEQEAQDEENAADKVARLSPTVLSQFHRIYLCSTADIAGLPASLRDRARVLPNMYDPTFSLAPAPTDDRFIILFIGTLGYFPNADGIDWFVRTVLPRIQAQTTRDVVVQIVGVGKSQLVQALSDVPGVELVGYVRDVVPWYERCHCVVVPLHAAGGSRIKILEAFSLQRPVVSTTIGVEGIDAIDGTHLLIADDSHSFARACLRLIAQPDLATHLTDHALSLVFERYTPASLATNVAPELRLPLL